ncbi:MAG: hypothetical protein ACOC1X_03795 [Promethearchaeota archaeon]
MTAKQAIVVLAIIVVSAVIGGFLDEAVRDFYDENFGDEKAEVLELSEVSELSDKELKMETKKLFKNIYLFLREREANEPEIDFDNWEESTKRQIVYSRETMNLYKSNFHFEVISIREEYAKRNVTSETLDTYYRHPTNPIGIEQVAYGLVELANKL